LKDEYIQWPNIKEKEAVGFCHCVGIIDRTLIKLQLTPQDHPETYFSRKEIHALTVLVGVQ
jgi:hypothetical protein